MQDPLKSLPESPTISEIMSCTIRLEAMPERNQEKQHLTRYKRSHQAVASTLDDTICLFHLISCEYMTLNETGSDIWGLLQEPLTLSEITDLLASTYDITAEECKGDVELWLDSAIGYGVIDVIS